MTLTLMVMVITDDERQLKTAVPQKQFQAISPPCCWGLKKY